jgi:NAD(P)-dependent dehydrogenase (short-subunit alcohol dehydrogenase family)
MGRWVAFDRPNRRGAYGSGIASGADHRLLVRDRRPDVFPGGGVYHATKHAVEAVSDALRFEVAGFGVQVVCIEPGLIKTGFGDAAVGSIAGELAARRPRPRYTVTPSAKLGLLQRRLVSDRMWDRLMATQLPRPGA